MHDTFEFRWLVQRIIGKLDKGDATYNRRPRLQMRRVIVTPKRNPHEWLCLSPDDYSVRYTEWADVPTMVEEVGS